MKHRRFFFFPGFALSLFVSIAFAGEHNGWFGFTVKVDGQFFSLDPILRAATITKVVAGSPAAKKGMTVGDQIIEVEGVAIAGKRMKEIQPLMQKEAGEAIRLQMKRPNGSTYRASPIAVARPPQQD